MSKPSDGVRALAALPSLGLTSAQMLADAGVPDPEALRELGAIGAYRRLRFHFGKRATINFVYAMECALRGMPWQLLEDERAAELKAQAQAVAAELGRLAKR